MGREHGLKTCSACSRAALFSSFNSQNGRWSAEFAGGFHFGILRFPGGVFLREPVVDFPGKSRGDFGVLFDEIVRFRLVIGEAVEFPRVGFVFVVELVALPVHLVDDGGGGLGSGVHVAGEEVEDGLTVFDALRVGGTENPGKGFAVEWVCVRIGPPLSPCEFEAGGIKVEAVGHVIGHGAGGNDAGPAGDEGNADPAFGEHAFFTFQRCVLGVGSAVVGGEEDERVFGDAVTRVAVSIGIFDRFTHPAQVLVDAGDESGILRFGFRILLCCGEQIGAGTNGAVDGVGVELEVEGLVTPGQTSERVFEGIADGVADVFGRSDEFTGKFLFRHVGVIVGRCPLIEMAEADSSENPFAVPL